MNPLLVLIVGDNDVADSVQRMRQILQAQGFTVRYAANLDAALSCTREFSPFCLIMADVVFSDVSYWEAVSQMRAVEPALQVVLIRPKNSDLRHIADDATPYISVEKGRRIVFEPVHSSFLVGANGICGMSNVFLCQPVKPAELVRFVKFFSEQCLEN